MKIVFATHNQHKVDEINQILGTSFEIVSLKQMKYINEIPEAFDTLEQNSLVKAKTVTEELHCNCFSEDTGLFIESIDMEPGVYSARYAGNDATSAMNIEKVLQKLQHIENRNAFFKTVITLIVDNSVHQFSGECHGTITQQVQGVGGFGYDPIFIANSMSKTFAECNEQEKNSVSHRKKAVEKMVLFLQQLHKE